MNKRKIFNDPVYGFISIPYDVIFDLIQHPYFQRLRRIQQLGFSNLVYPGATHTRFHHSLGAMHLMGLALDTIERKGIALSNEDKQAATVAILLHDIGHGPYSHALESTLVEGIHHEAISLAIMEQLSQSLGYSILNAIQLFNQHYPKKFLYKLVSGQLDMDRMDYLNRDSFYTGVSEGVIGYDRIINMLDVVDDSIVVEEKGIYSIEKFLVARRLMYWQVYLHKTVLCAELILKKIINYLRTYNYTTNNILLNKFILGNNTIENVVDWLPEFCLLDDADILLLLKELLYHKDPILVTLADALINRNLFHVEFNTAIAIEQKQEQLRKHITKSEFEHLVYIGTTSNKMYNTDKDPIYIKQKNNSIINFSSIAEQWNIHTFAQPTIKHYICYPKQFYKYIAL